MVSNLQQTTLDEVIHSVRYNFDYYRIHARLNFYSNSKNPRVIQTRFKNQKLTTLRTNPHDPYYARPGEFLTLAKMEAPDTYYDEVLSYYVRSKSRHLLSAPLQNQAYSDERRPRSQSRDVLKSSRSRDQRIRSTGNYRLHTLRGRSVGRPDPYEVALVSSQTPRCTLDDVNATSKGYCPVHLTPHKVIKDFKIFRDGRVTPEECSRPRSFISKQVRERTRSSSNSRSKYSKNSNSMRSVSESSRRRSRSVERRKLHEHEITSLSHLEHMSRPVSQELKDQHRHTAEISAILNEVRRVSAGNSGAKWDSSDPHSHHKKTRKIKRKLVRRTNESQRADLRSDHSVVTADVSSNLIDMTSIKDRSLTDLDEPRILKRRVSSSHGLEPPPLPIRPVSQPISHKVLSSSLGADPITNHILAKGDLRDTRETHSHSDLGVKKSLRFQDHERLLYSRPNSRHVFRTASLRNLSKDPRCHCKTCVGPKPWQITMSDVSLTAARLSTGSDRMTSSQQQKPKLSSRGHDAFAESFREARARCNPLITMSILDDYYDE